jgi:hypothetical protein
MDCYFIIAERGVRYISAVSHGFIDSRAQTAFDNLQLFASHERLEFAVFLVKLVVEVIDFARRDDFCPRRFESF